MVKRLVVGLDGTWNSADTEGKQPVTNVVKIMRAIPPLPRHDPPDDGSPPPDPVAQVTFYDEGVGTETGLWDRIMGGATGLGLEKNIRDGYRFLVNNYDKNDQVYIFGFSRGAYTARSLAGFIGTCGLLEKQHVHLIGDAWEIYRTPPELRGDQWHMRRNQIREKAYKGFEIDCLGVWDTVGALGIPADILRRVNRKAFAFHDTQLGPIVRHAFHAVAIDERRGPFEATLWSRPEGAAPHPGQVVEQVWFPGGHSNVGGGCREEENGLEDNALRWMMRRIERADGLGLVFDRTLLRRLQNEDQPLEPQLDMARSSLLYWYSNQVPLVRIIGGFLPDAIRFAGFLRSTLGGSNKRAGPPPKGEVFINEMVHETAIRRFGAEVLRVEANGSATRVPYRPHNLRVAWGKLPWVASGDTKEHPAGTWPVAAPPE